MSLKVRPPWKMPEETAVVGQAIIKPDSPYRLIGEQLFPQFREADYADLYSAEGKPGISPIILAFVTVFQFMEKLPDRQAAESMRMRIDWKYALHLPLTNAGFDYSVLSEFRDRLIQHEAEGRVFETLVQAFQTMGLVKARGKQRTDSTAMLTKVRRLSRLELVVETLRLAVGAMMTVERQWSEALIPPSWEQRYGERFVMQRYSKKEGQDYEADIGEDGQWLLSRLEEGGAPADLKDLQEVQVLKTVWAQQFRETQGKMAYQELKKYDGHTQIQTPHDPEARYSRKRRTEWVGDKVQLTETEDEGYPHLITDIVGTGSNHTDYEELSPIQLRLEKRRCKPSEHYVDAGYLSGPNLKDSQAREIDLIGPLPTIVTPQDRIPDGITHAQFQVDIQNMCVACPQGHTASNPSPVGNSLHFRFPKPVCATCELRPRCCTGKGGRTIGISAYYEQVRAARNRQETETFKKDYHLHRSGVEGSLSALVRGNGLRVARYIGHKKRHLQVVFTGCAANIQRTARWQAGIRPQTRYKGWGFVSN